MQPNCKHKSRSRNLVGALALVLSPSAPHHQKDQGTYRRPERTNEGIDHIPAGMDQRYHSPYGHDDGHVAKVGLLHRHFA